MYFVHIQYPIIDLRHFLNDEFKREQPSFPAPRPNTWLRNFGHVRTRRTDTSPYYLAENYYCDAHNAVRFEELPLFRGKIRYEFDDDMLDPLDSLDEDDYDYQEELIYNKVCRFRRFRSDGLLKSCFEIGLELYPEEDERFFTTHEELKKINVRVKSYRKKDKIGVPIHELGEPVCKLYEDSTSIKQTPVKSVYSGRPCVVYVDYSGEQEFHIASVSSKGYYLNEFSIHPYDDENVIAWVIDAAAYDYDKKLLASIRRALLAIALEKESLLAAFNFLLLNADKDFIEKEKVLCYIKKTQEKLLRSIRFGIPQSQLVDLLFKFDFKNNKPFYHDIVNLISKVGDRYLVNDFSKLFIELEFDEWRTKIIEILNHTQDKDLRKKLKQLDDICLSEDRGKFWAFVQKYIIDIIGLGIFSDILSDLLKILFNL